jgi:hypothetical protein
MRKVSLAFKLISRSVITEPSPTVVFLFDLRFSQRWLTPCSLVESHQCPSKKQTCSRCFLASIFFYTVDGGDTILRNVGSHIAPQPRKRLSFKEEVGAKRTIWFLLGDSTDFYRTTRRYVPEISILHCCTFCFQAGNGFPTGSVDSNSLWVPVTEELVIWWLWT